MQCVHEVATARSKSESVNTLFIKPTSKTNNSDNSNETRANINMFFFMIVAMFLYCDETNKYIQILTFFGFFSINILQLLFMIIHIANPHRNSGIPTLIFQRRYTLVACGCS